MFDPILKAIGWLLALFYAAVPNLGISIILLTFTIMLLLYPLTAKQARSMIAMQMHQPEIKRIQERYKDDRQRLQRELMAFYQENKINPFASCVPLLLQLPVFFALFSLLRSDEFKTEIHAAGSNPAFLGVTLDEKATGAALIILIAL